MLWGQLGAIASIILVDLLLSGDNALVIGAAASGFPRRQRWLALSVGGTGAIVLRITLSLVSTVVLNWPWIQSIGGIVVLIIAIRLLADRKSTVSPKKETDDTSLSASSTAKQNLIKHSLLAAMLTILVADVTMSLDNILAVGAIANGDFMLLIGGVFLSVLVLLLGSALVAELVERMTWLLDLAALVLAWTGANMVLSDESLSPVLNHFPWTIAIPVAALAIVAVADIYLRRHNRDTRA
jgi:YjbE family integral membrane protein